jgi:hypothetical protein
VWLDDHQWPRTGTWGAGKVLQTDASGVLSWQTPAGGDTSFVDFVADADLNMAGRTVHTATLSGITLVASTVADDLTVGGDLTVNKVAMQGQLQQVTSTTTLTAVSADFDPEVQTVQDYDGGVTAVWIALDNFNYRQVFAGYVSPQGVVGTPIKTTSSTHKKLPSIHCDSNDPLGLVGVSYLSDQNESGTDTEPYFLAVKKGEQASGFIILEPTGSFGPPTVTMHFEVVDGVTKRWAFVAYAKGPLIRGVWLLQPSTDQAYQFEAGILTTATRFQRFPFKYSGTGPLISKITSSLRVKISKPGVASLTHPHAAVSFLVETDAGAGSVLSNAVFKESVYWHCMYEFVLPFNIVAFDVVIVGTVQQGFGNMVYAFQVAGSASVQCGLAMGNDPSLRKQNYDANGNATGLTLDVKPNRQQDLIPESESVSILSTVQDGRIRLHESADGKTVYAVVHDEAGGKIWCRKIPNADSREGTALDSTTSPIHMVMTGLVTTLNEPWGTDAPFHRFRRPTTILTKSEELVVLALRADADVNIVVRGGVSARGLVTTVSPLLSFSGPSRAMPLLTWGPELYYGYYFGLNTSTQNIEFGRLAGRPTISFLPSGISSDTSFLFNSTNPSASGSWVYQHNGVIQFSMPPAPPAGNNYVLKGNTDGSTRWEAP